MRGLIEGLKRYAARDSRSRLTGNPRHASLGAFVARKVERFAVLRLDRAVLMVLLEGRKELWRERLGLQPGKRWFCRKPGRETSSICRTRAAVPTAAWRSAFPPLWCGVPIWHTAI